MTTILPTPDEFNMLDIPVACLVVLKLIMAEEKHAARSYGNPRFPGGIEPLLERRFQRGAVFSSAPGYEGVLQRQVATQLARAWQWAHSEGYLVDLESGSSQITQEGIEYAESKVRIQQVSQLRYLHPSIRAKVESKFRTGENSDAIGLAFKNIEATARAKAWPSGNSPTKHWIGQAFKVGNVQQGVSDGPLVNSQYDTAKKHAIQKMFDGAFGTYRNLHLHQDPLVSEGETVKILGQTSLLMEELDKLP